MSECYRILKDDSAAYIFCSAKTLDFFMQQARNAGFTIKNVLIWRKNNHTAGDLEAQYGQCYEPILYLNKGRRTINGKRLEDVWDFDRVPSDKLVHQNEKPIPLRGLVRDELVEYCNQLLRKGEIKACVENLFYNFKRYFWRYY